GSILGLVALVCAIAYLVLERGSLLDPITASWAGYFGSVAMAMVATAILIPLRGRDAIKDAAIMGMVLALFGYIIGLYASKGKWLAKRLPVPRPSLSMTQIWLMWVLSVVILGFSIVLGRFIPMSAASVSKGIFDGAVGSATLLSVMVLIGHRGQWGTKI